MKDFAKKTLDLYENAICSNGLKLLFSK